MPPKANLQYTAPKVPAFLQKLHAQVNGGRGSGSGGGRNHQLGSDDAPLREGEEDDLARLVAGSHRGGGEFVEDEGRSGDAGGNGDGDSDDEWAGAQVVVLKEGKHLTAEEIALARQKEQADGEEERQRAERAARSQASQAQISSVVGSAPKTQRKRKAVGDAENDEEADSESDQGSDSDRDTTHRKRQPGDTLAGAKDLIEADRKRKASEAKARDKQDRRQAKIKERERKNKAAKKEIGKRGKGLSFAFDD